jgi:hypothetical protein
MNARISLATAAFVICLSACGNVDQAVDSADSVGVSREALGSLTSVRTTAVNTTVSGTEAISAGQVATVTKFIGPLFTMTVEERGEICAGSSKASVISSASLDGAIPEWTNEPLMEGGVRVGTRRFFRYQTVVNHNFVFQYQAAPFGACNLPKAATSLMVQVTFPSCMATSCGKNLLGLCWCDSFCSLYGDCCPSRRQACDPLPIP